MSRLLDIQSDMAVAIGVSSIIGAGILFNSYKFINRILDDKPPKRWRKVGELSELWCFPIKSCGGVKLSEIPCGQLGVFDQHLRDRVFMVAREDGELVSARTYPTMMLIKPKIIEDMLTISAPQMKDLQINITKLYSLQNKITTNVFGDRADCIDCGDEAAQWFTKYLLSKEKGLRLAFYPSSKPKPVIIDKKYLFEQADQKDTGALQDETSFMMMNLGSFDDLNSKIEKPVVPLQYRPNFVVKGPTAWEEDKWKWIKIGQETIFKVVQPCTRCVLTNIDPTTGERNPKMEPLKTLKEFRVFKNISESPFFGVHLGIRKTGIVKVGDEIYVAE